MGHGNLEELRAMAIEKGIVNREGNVSALAMNYFSGMHTAPLLDEIWMLDNRYALLFIRGERAVQDEKYDILRHPNIKLTADGGRPPYAHGQAPHAFEPQDILLGGDYDDYEVLSEDEIIQLYENQKED